MSNISDPREIALSAHRDYYNAGSFDDDRLAWTVSTFLSDINSKKVLEVGCGNGTMLNLLSQKGINAVGVDASSSGISVCQNRGLHATCLDASTQALPFPDDFFDAVISLETFEHLMNPHYALMEVRRVLRSGGRFICSVPNPRTGHPYLYPGLFEYSNFSSFLLQNNLSIEQVVPWQWAPRESILPESLRKFRLLRSRPVAGGLRYLMEKVYLAVGAFPAFSYWLWTFQCRNDKSANPDIFDKISHQTRPGAVKHFSISK